MGILGSLIYPKNEEMARELNEAEDKLRQTNNLHNDLVNSYRAVAEATRTFDSYLMSIMVMQYLLVYTQEDLSNLPDVKIPKLSKYWADQVQSLALDSLAVMMAVDGCKAMYLGVANVCKEGGILRRLFACRQSQDVAAEAEVTEEMVTEVVGTGIRVEVLQVGDVSILTGPEDVVLEISSELEVASSEASEVLSEAEGFEEVSAVAQSAGEGAKIAQEGSRLGRLARGASAVLGPVLLVVTVVTEILDVIHEGAEKKKLEEAARKMKDAQDQMDASVNDLKKIFLQLLKAAITDVQTYNKLLPNLAALEHAAMFDRDPFRVTGLQSYIDGMSGITIEASGIRGYEVAALQNLDEATEFIRRHAEHDSKMTAVIQQIKAHMRKNNLTQLLDGDPFLMEVADVNSIGLPAVQGYNHFRVYLAECASALLPYHKQIQEGSTPGSLPKTPDKVTPGTPDPAFDPKPGDFTIPAMKAA